MNNRPWLIPAIALGVVALYLVVTMLPPSDPAGTMHLARAGRLMTNEGGRFKPLDSYARTQMMLMSKRQTYQDVNDKTQPAIRWLFDTLAFGLSAYYQMAQFITLDDPEMLRFLELPPRETKLYKIDEIAEKPQLKREMDRILKLHQQGEKLTPFDRKFFGLTVEVFEVIERAGYARTIRQELDKRKADRSPIFRIENDQVLALLGLPRRDGLRYGWAEIMGSKNLEQFKRQVDQASERPEKDWTLLDGKSMELHRHLIPQNEVASLSGMLLVPPTSAGAEASWQNLRNALIRADRMGEANAPTAALENLIRAYGMGEVEKFNEAVTSYQKTLDERFPAETGTVRFEAWFNSFAPFYQCTLLSILAFVLICVSWVGWQETLNRIAFGLLGMTFVVMTFALLARMYIQGRPPVTNLYSSAVFIGWGALLLCLALEYLFKLGVGNLVGAVMGFLTTLIAHHLAASGDTLEMMQAVLDTNFWLATHVTCVTLGYVATFVAGFVAIVYTVRGLFTTSLDQATSKMLTQMIYGLVCFAMLLSFVGTVLGGIWADQSWGRFWGWDPKENGALLIVVMNGLILHARWGGLIKDRGVAILAMCGNMITLWSWFGTNQLGIGLHSYGVNKTLVEVCRYSWIFQGLLIIVASVVPRSSWRSFRPENSPSAADRSRRDHKTSAAAPALSR